MTALSHDAANDLANGLMTELGSRLGVVVAVHNCQLQQKLDVYANLFSNVLDESPKNACRLLLGVDSFFPRSCFVRPDVQPAEECVQPDHLCVPIAVTAAMVVAAAWLFPLLLLPAAFLCCWGMILRAPVAEEGCREKGYGNCHYLAHVP